MASFKRIQKSLSRAHKNALVQTRDVENFKAVVLSDLHRGRRGKADDFVQCEATYLNALAYYLEKGYELILLGDVEEFWENRVDNVMKAYPECSALEREFYLQNRLFRVWGNHDDIWKYEAVRARHLHADFNHIQAYEAINISLTQNDSPLGQLALMHGHQGSLSSEVFAGTSRFFVRFFWKPIQWIFNVKLTAPSNSIALRSKHDLALHAWARDREKTLLICGHTHQPIFMSKTHIDYLQERKAILSENASQNQKAIDSLSLKIAKLRMQQHDFRRAITEQKPCYFNTGCCSFDNGMITGIEIEKGKIRLVKWDPKSQREIKTENEICAVLDQC